VTVSVCLCLSVSVCLCLSVYVCSDLGFSISLELTAPMYMKSEDIAVGLTPRRAMDMTKDRG